MMYPEQLVIMYILVIYSALFFVDSLYVFYKGAYERYGDYTKTSLVVYGLRAACGIALSFVDRDMVAMMIIVSVIIDVAMHRNANRISMTDNYHA